MTTPRFILDRLSLAQALVLSLGLFAGVFLGGHAVLEATGLHPCDDECEFIDCEPPSGPPGCGGCGQYVEWEDWWRAGDHCVSCLVGRCKYLIKVNPDQCGICDDPFVQQCQSCMTGY